MRVGLATAWRAPGPLRGDAEVDEPDVLRGVEQDVGGLDVLVDDAAAVHLRQGLRELDGHLEECLRRVPGGLQKLAQRHPSEVLLDEHRPALLLLQALDADHPRDIQEPADGVLVLEPGDILQGGILRGRHLQEHGLPVRHAQPPVRARPETALEQPGHLVPDDVLHTHLRDPIGGTWVLICFCSHRALWLSIQRKSAV